MNKKLWILSLFALVCGLTTTGLQAKSNETRIGIVDFTRCITDSKYGKQEQENFEKLRLQMEKSMQDLGEQLQATESKLKDPDVLDSLSPDAEKELRTKLASLGEELGRYQNQYYYVMQQANMKLMTTMTDVVGKASSQVAQDKHFSLVMNKDQVFHFSAYHDVTDLIISELDRNYELDAKAAAKAE